MIGHVEVMAGRWARRFAAARSASSGRQLMGEEVNGMQRGNEYWQRNYWTPMKFFSLQPRTAGIQRL
jgi:hypothetical protein